jgi:hypothetical protein
LDFFLYHIEVFINMNKSNKITRTYDIVSDMKKNKISEATDVYSNVDFKDRVVGSSTPSKDDINVSLLQDIQTAAKNANVKVDITTAVSGHKPGTRHETGNAVDIAVINGKSVRPSNREDADKLVRELVKLGYSKNVPESGNDKVVLTFGMKDHDNHVHVSKKSNTPSSEIKTGTETETPSEEGGYLSSITGNMAKAIMPVGTSVNVLDLVGLKEDIERIKELL